MFRTLLRGARRRHGLRLFAFCTFASLCVVTSSTAKVSPPKDPPPKLPYFNQGLRWIGTASVCMAPRDWTTKRLFTSPKLPASLTGLCTYTWTPASRAPAPTTVEVSLLFTVSQAKEMTEDVPVVLQSGFSDPEVAVFAGLRDALRAHVGDVSLLPDLVRKPPAHPNVRVVVIDTAPDAAHGAIIPGVSRHGDTLAHLIEDLVCLPASLDFTSRACAAEITTALALANGTGTLSDLASAIERAVSTWQLDMDKKPATTPTHLILNLSLGWEDTEAAECSTESPLSMKLPARTVLEMLQYASSQGALIIAAAGNDSGGPVPRRGLVCPGRYQAVPQPGDLPQSLVVAVSGVDYHDLPLETARPFGITGIAGLGLGGIAWDPADPVPPALTGSSVSTAVVSAVSALVWAYQPAFTTAQVTSHVYYGGTEVGNANECPLSILKCSSRRASVCGALGAAGAPLTCSPAQAEPWSSPDLPVQIDELIAAANVPLITGIMPVPLDEQTLPRRQFATVQLEPWAFPQPIEETCPTCAARAASVGQPATPAVLFIPALGQDLHDAQLVVNLATAPGSTPLSLHLGELLASGTPYKFELPASWVVQSAYITGVAPLQKPYSVTQQILVQQAPP